MFGILGESRLSPHTLPRSMGTPTGDSLLSISRPWAPSSSSPREAKSDAAWLLPWPAPQLKSALQCAVIPRFNYKQIPNVQSRSTPKGCPPLGHQHMSCPENPKHLCSPSKKQLCTNFSIGNTEASQDRTPSPCQGLGSPLELRSSPEKSPCLRPHRDLSQGSEREGSFLISFH